MSALKEEKIVSPDIKLVYDLTVKPNNTHLKAKVDRAVMARMRLDLVLPEDNILTVDVDFDTTSGYHGNIMMIMDDFGVELLATAFQTKYGTEAAECIKKAWREKQQENDPRKPSYLLVQKPEHPGALPKVFATCGGKKHDNIVPPDCIL
ncbi:hypothetical protein [Colwellia sp. MEBiC06753]